MTTVTAHRAGARARLRAGASFVRFSALGGTRILPLLGAASTGTRPTPGELVALLIVGTSFHLFAYIMNDVIDLPVDRTEPRRSGSPLVTGTVKPYQALIIALAQVPVAFAAATALPRGESALVALVAAFLLLACYNLFGKRCRVPPLTDLVQGLGWAALLLFGASATGRAVTASWVVATFIAVFIVMANGLHGALRDLPNDLRSGVRSTAIWFGARPDSRDASAGVLAPRRMVRYAWALHAALFGILLGPLALGALAYTAVALTVTAAALLILAAATSGLLVAAIRGLSDVGALRAAGMLHLVATLLGPVILLAHLMDAHLRVVVAVAFTVPLLTHGWLPAALRWLAAQAHPAGQRVGALLMLIRLQNCLAASAATVLGGYLSGAQHWFTSHLVVASAAVFCLVAAANALNDARDVAIDRLNARDRPIPSGRTTPRAAYGLATDSAIIGLLLCALLGWGPLLAGSVIAFLAVAYCWALKSTVLVGNVVVGVLSGTTVIYGAAVVAGVSRAAVLAGVLVCVFIISGEVLKCVSDASADAAVGLHTVATVLPERTVVRIYGTLAAAAGSVALVPWVLDVVSTRAAVAIAPAVLLPTATVWALLTWRPGQRSLRLALRLSKVAWATGLLAMTQLR